jgi:hypothetical protein
MASLLALGACSFNLGGGQNAPSPAGPAQITQNTPDVQKPLPPAPKADVDTSHVPLGLEPLGGPASPASQLMSEGTLGYLLDHLFGGTTSGHLSRAYVPQPAFSTTTAGGVPGGLWPGNWWIQGQGGGYNLTHLP